MPAVDINTIPTFAPQNLTQEAAANTAAPAAQAPAPTNTPTAIEQPSFFDNFDANDAFDAGKKAWDYFKPDAGGLLTGGAATGSLTAGGGTVVTGAGLAGTASPINLAGAGKASTGLFSGGVSSGLATAGIGLAAGFLGDKLFGGYGGAGSAIGATVGSALGPVGTILGGLAGGAIGGLFGDSGPSKSYYGVGGAGAFSGNKGVTSQKLALGDISIQGRRGAKDVVAPTLDAFTKMDDAIAGMLTPEQLKSVQGYLGGNNVPQSHAATRTNFDQFQNVLTDSVTNRYATAIGGVDPQWSGVYRRVADSENQMGLFSTAVNFDNAMRAGEGIFAGQEAGTVNEGIDFAGEQYGIAKPVPQQHLAAPTSSDKPTGRPVSNQFSADKDNSGDWTWVETKAYAPILGKQAEGEWQLNDKKDAAYMGGSIKGSESTGWGKKQAAWKAKNAAIDAANSKTQGAYEREVLDRYARDGQSPAGAAGGSSGIQVEREEQPASSPNTTNNTEYKKTINKDTLNRWKGGTRFHSAEHKPANDDTNANIIKRGLF